MGALVELRVLEGPNLYVTRAAVKLTLDVSGLLGLEPAAAQVLATRLGLGATRPGAAGSGFRQRFAVRLLARLVRRLAAEVGVTRLAVRVRTTGDLERLVVAYPWRRRGTATALGEQLGAVLDRLAADPAGDVDGVLAEAGATIRAAEPGETPRTLVPRIPVIAVTGTNGKTTTARMVAHIARSAGLHVGWSSTDGIYVDGVLVEEGDYSGPSGAGRVLAHPEVQLAVTETARGGILLRGIGVTHNDVSVVTNISADHLGAHGIDTLDQLAEVKGVVPRITRPGGWAVLNADDPRTLSMREATRASVWAFSRDPESPGIRDALGTRGRATTLIDGWISVLGVSGDARPVVPIADVPMTLAGLSRFNVENALAATSAALAAGLSWEAVADGLRGFVPGPDLNPGRMNVYSLGDVTVVVDLAHNEAGLTALTEIMRGLRAPGGRLLLAVGTAGDRTDAIVEALGEMAARDADRVVVVHKDDYLRGRSRESLDALYAAGAARVGVESLPSYPSELEGLQVLAAEAEPGDVVAVMTHQDRPALDAWLRAQGATVDGTDELRRKVLVATGEGSGAAPGAASGLGAGTQPDGAGTLLGENVTGVEHAAGPQAEAATPDATGETVA